MDCLHCGKAITNGNKNKRYCNEAHKDAYNNAQKKRQKDEFKKHQDRLMDNWRILKRMYGNASVEDRVAVSKSDLTKEKFRFNYHSHHHITKKGREIIFCFTYGYREEDGQYLLFKSYDI